MNKGAIIGLSVGGAAVLGLVIWAVVNKSKKDSDFESKSLEGNFGSTGAQIPTPAPATPPAPVEQEPRLPNTAGDKKATIDKWKNYKSEIKPVCGRRRIMGKKKIAWFDCVGNYSGFSGFDGFSDNFEINEVLTDI